MSLMSNLYNSLLMNQQFKSCSQHFRTKILKKCGETESGVSPWTDLKLVTFLQVIFSLWTYLISKVKDSVKSVP